MPYEGDEGGMGECVGVGVLGDGTTVADDGGDIGDTVTVECPF